jgi:hypothetical protein
MHAVKMPALPTHLFRGNLPQAPYFREFLFWESAFDNEKPVDMPKQGVVGLGHITVDIFGKPYLPTFQG